jgi:hypothetical protein
MITALNDLAVANDIAPYVRKYNVQTVAYSKGLHKLSQVG